MVKRMPNSRKFKNRGNFGHSCTSCDQAVSGDALIMTCHCLAYYDPELGAMYMDTSISLGESAPPDLTTVEKRVADLRVLYANEKIPAPISSTPTAFCGALAILARKSVAE